MFKMRGGLRLLWLVPLALVAIGGIAVVRMMAPPPPDLDLRLTKSTDHGLYVGTLEPDHSPVAVGPIHSWVVVVTTPSGEPVDNATIMIDGGMPQHGHGLPTKPMVTGEVSKGHYSVEGMKFNMPGWWEINLEISGPAGTDTATFNLSL